MKKFKNRILKIFIVSCMFLAVISTSAVYAVGGSHGGNGGSRESTSSSSGSSSSSTSTTQVTQGTTKELLPEDYSPQSGQIDNIAVPKFTSRFFNFLYIIAVIVSIIMVMYVGLKYITGSVSEKAEYKKSLIPMAIGMLLIAFLVTIIKIIISVANSI